jgi:hypothetical protein
VLLLSLAAATDAEADGVLSVGLGDGLGLCVGQGDLVGREVGDGSVDSDSLGDGSGLSLASDEGDASGDAAELSPLGEAGSWVGVGRPPEAMEDAAALTLPFPSSVQAADARATKRTSASITNPRARALPCVHLVTGISRSGNDRHPPAPSSLHPNAAAHTR